MFRSNPRLIQIVIEKMQEEPPEQCEHPEPKNGDIENVEVAPAPKRARAGQGVNGPSFARRACPKHSPSKERWQNIKAVFEKVLGPYIEHELCLPTYTVQVWLVFGPCVPAEIVAN